MSDILTSLFEGFTTTITSFATGLKDGFMNLLYVDPEASTKVVSDPVKFLLIFGGVGIAMGLFWKVLGLIRRRG